MRKICAKAFDQNNCRVNFLLLTEWPNSCYFFPRNCADRGWPHLGTGVLFNTCTPTNVSFFRISRAVSLASMRNKGMVFFTGNITTARKLAELMRSCAFFPFSTELVKAIL